MRLTSVQFAALVCVPLLSASAWAQSLSFDLPGSDVVNRSNVSFLLFGGACSEPGEQVPVSGPASFSATALCRDTRRWEISNVSLTELSEGSLTFTAQHAGAPAVTRTLSKDTIAPALSLRSPSNGSTIDAINQTALPVRGTCGEISQPVTVRARPATAASPSVQRSVTCPSTRSFSTTLDVSGLPDGDVQILVQHRDAAGNTAQQDIILYKDSHPTEVTLAPIGAYIPAARSASLQLEGTCNKPGNFIYLDVTGPGDYLTTLVTLCPNDQRWVFSNLSVTDAPDGPLTFMATLVNDLTGEASSAEVTSIKDTAPPVLQVSAPGPGTRVNLTTGTVLTVAGTCSEATPVSVAIAGQSVGEAACAAGAFTFTHDLQGFPDGDVLVRVRQADVAGNLALQDLSLLKDVRPASVTLTPPTAGAFINVSNAAHYVLSGTCSEHGSFAQPVLVGGLVTASALCDSGTWSTTLSLTEVPDGPITFTVSHGDAGGNPPARATLALTKDVVPPVLWVSSPSPQSGVRASVNAGNVSALGLRGTCSEDGSSVAVSGALAGATVCAAGAFSYDADFTAAPEGDLLVNLTVTDVAGNSSTQSLGFFKDTLLPSFTLSGVGDPAILNTSSASELVLSGECSESEDFATPVQLLSPTQAEAMCIAGQWWLTVSLTGLSDDAGTLWLEHRDHGGNVARLERGYLKDTVPPVLTVTRPGPGMHVNASNQGAVVVEGACNEEWRSVELSGAVPATAPCIGGQYSLTLDLTGVPDGDVALRARLTDALGNAAVQDVIVHKDTVVPSLTLTSVGDPVKLNAGTAAELLLEGQCSESGDYAMPVRLVEPVSATAACNTGSWSLKVSVAELADGSGLLRFAHADQAGNLATLERAYVKDTAPPLLTVTSPGPGSSVNASNFRAVSMSGACNEEGRPVQLSGPVSAVATCSGGAYAMTVSLAGVADGTLTLRVRLEDALGNAALQDVVVLKDTVSPGFSVDAPVGSDLGDSETLTLQGACTEVGQPVVVRGARVATGTCASTRTFSVPVSVAGLTGSLAFELEHRDLAGNASVVKRTFERCALTPVTDQTPVGPSGRIVSVDFNGDGLLDVATTTQVYLAQAPGSPGGPFRAPLRYSPSAYNSVTVTDINRDGVPDLVGAMGYIFDLLIGRNVGGRGDGTFTRSPAIEFHWRYGSPPVGAAADFNRDGLLDLLSTSGYDGELQVSMGRRACGSASGVTFDAPRLIYTPTQKIDIQAAVVADFNGDGWSDLALAANWAYSIMVFLGQSGGVTGGILGPPTSYASGFIASTSDLIAADLNGDGALDLATANTSATTSFVLYGKKSNGAATGTFLPVHSAQLGGGVMRIAAGDFDGDGVQDLLGHGGNGTSQLMLLQGRTDPGASGHRFARAFSYPLGTTLPGGGSGLVVRDFNADGIADYATSDVFGNLAVKLRSDPWDFGPDPYGPAVAYPSTTSGSQLVVGDFNADGLSDLAYGDNAIVVNLGRGTAGVGDGTFEAAKVSSPIPGSSWGQMQDLTVADFNADGVSDLVVLDKSNRRVLVRLANRVNGLADGTFAPPVVYALGTQQLGRLVVGAFDGDGILDVLTLVNQYDSTVNALRHSLAALRGRGDGTFEPLVLIPLNTNARSMISADFNADGRTDLAFSSDSSDNVQRIYRYETLVLLGGGTNGNMFMPPVRYAASRAPEHITFLDINADGARDIVPSSGLTGLAVMQNGIPTGTFQFTDLPLPDNSLYWNYFAADYSGDGVTDIVKRGTGVRLLKGTYNGTALQFSDDVAYTFPLFRGVDAADFNGDGALDLAVLESGGVSVMLKRGAPAP